MITIKSKKTGKTQTIGDKEWEAMKSKLLPDSQKHTFASLFTVVRETTKKAAPEELKSFTPRTKPSKSK